MTEGNKEKIIKVSGPLVVGTNMHKARMFDVVKVSKHGLIGEIIEIKDNDASIQVYEETSGIGPSEPIYLTGHPLSVELGPGLITAMYDGIQRPLDLIEKKSGSFISRGIEVPALDRQKKWDFQPLVHVGDQISGGDILGQVQETELITHKIMAPPNISGKVEKIEKGEHTIEDVIAVVDGQEIIMMQIWPIRQPRPYKKKLVPSEPMITGQRVIDTFFPIVQGGTGCVPGPFGAGKTVIQHQMAKWADADVVIFIGCGERGNEMTDVLTEFPELKDPRTGRPLMERTVLIANTSNMPVAAREASVYTGITIAEYFRDMGYKVALTADSTSRWAEALREMSGRLEEMPGEEGYPAYLGSKTASFYERAGKVVCQGSDRREGALTAIGAVSPPGGDLSEPVTQNTLRVTKVFWGLEANLAYKRHFPAINWLTSYSLYHENIEEYFRENVAEDWPEIRKEAMSILQKEASLEEIVKLVGFDSLSEKEQILLYTAKSLREDFLQQFAFDEIDTYTSLKKQYLILKVILTYHHLSLDAVERGVKIKDLSIATLFLKEKIGKAKLIPEDRLNEFDGLIDEIEVNLKKLK